MQQSNLAVRLTNGRSLPIQLVTGRKDLLNSDSTEGHKARRRREIQFAQLPSGTLIDLMRDMSGELVFAVFKDGKSSLQEEVKEGGATFIVPQVHSSLLRAVRFSTGVGASNTARELLAEIGEVIDRYYDCDPADRKLLAHFALYSWVSDLLPVAPYIWVVGPYSWEKTRLLQIMSTICRRSIRLGEVSLPALYKITTALRPTLLLEESLMANGRNFLRMLRVGSTNRSTLLRDSKAYDLFGPKIIASRQGPGEADLANLGFSVVVRPFSRKVPVLTSDALDSIAEKLQPKLAAFRLTNYVRLRSAVDSQGPSAGAGFSRKVEDMAWALALPISGDTELMRELLTTVEGFDKHARIGRDREPEWFVAVALLDRAHWRGPGAPVSWTCNDLAQSVQLIAEQGGESFRPEPRKVGDILRSLGLVTKTLGSRGRGLRSSEALKDEIHRIALDFGICAGDLFFSSEFADAPVTCDRCDRLGLNFDDAGKSLRYELTDGV